MKLLLTWLVGVPALVGVMVLARATSSQGFHPPRATTTHASASCLRQDDFDGMRPMIAKQRDEVSCDGRSIE
jgi:hypothetical protein